MQLGFFEFLKQVESIFKGIFKRDAASQARINFPGTYIILKRHANVGCLRWKIRPTINHQIF